MTAVSQAPPEAADLPRREPTRTPARVAVRLLAIAGLAVFAYWDSFRAILTEITANTLLSYAPAAAVLCLVAAIGVSLRHEEERPIYDRDTDFIVGIIVLIMAIAFQGLLNLRFPAGYLITHIDVLSLLLFLFGGCVLLFGLRPTLRYRWVWLLSLSLFPLPYRILVLALGNTRVTAGAVMVLMAAVATGIAVGRTRRRAFQGAAGTLLIGALLLAAVWLTNEYASLAVYQWVPSVGAAFLAGSYWYIHQRRVAGTLHPFPHRDLRPLTAPRVPRAIALLAAAAGVLHYIGAPVVPPYAGPDIPGLTTRPPLIPPPGWIQERTSGLQPAPMNGLDAVRERQFLVQRTGEARFDVHARPRRIVVDTIETRSPLTLDIYIPALTYNVSGTRTSPIIDVPLPHGVTGQLQTIVDDAQLLTYNQLTWRWNNGTWTQQVTLFSVDNHENDAPFPQYRRRRDTWRVISGMLTMLFRGNAVTQDLNPRFKDRDLLVETAEALIETQVDAAGGVR